MSQPAEAEDIAHLHDEAMRHADEAHAARRRQELGRAQKEAVHAFRLETQAALAFAAEHRLQPSRGILFRSAAALALDAGLLDQAEYLARQAVEESPPEDVVEDAEDILTEASERRRLIAAALDDHGVAGAIKAAMRRGGPGLARATALEAIRGRPTPGQVDAYVTAMAAALAVAEEAAFRGVSLRQSPISEPEDLIGSIDGLPTTTEGWDIRLLVACGPLDERQEQVRAGGKA